MKSMRSGVMGSRRRARPAPRNGSLRLLDSHADGRADVDVQLLAG